MDRNIVANSTGFVLLGLGIIVGSVLAAAVLQAFWPLLFILLGLGFTVRLKKDPVGVIAPHLDAINHVHVSANDRGTPGKDHVPYLDTFRALKGGGYDGWLTIEAFGRALPDLAAATRVWRDFFPEPEEVYAFGHKHIRDTWAAA